MSLKHLVARVLVQSRLIPSDSKFAYINELSYPEDRDILVQFALQDPESKGYYVLNQETALSKIPYSREQEIYRQAFDSLKKTSSSIVQSTLIEAMPWPEEKERLLWMAEHGSNYSSCLEARNKIPLKIVGKHYLERAVKTAKTEKLLPEQLHDALKSAIFLAEWPPEGDYILFLQSGIARGVNADHTDPPLLMDVDAYRKDLVTLAGWSAAALGRAVTKTLKPDDISRLLHVTEDMPEEEKSLAILVSLLRDDQNRIPRFIRQGIIMGLLDWLLLNRAHPEAAKLLELVVSIRNEMIRTDHELSFFEIRVPRNTCVEDYAAILSDVLHCANPSLTFCDTQELLSIATREIPGCMKMLWTCPLRLIDPVNRQTLGFYQFKPYAHAMWVQYKPPKDLGQVIARYHEVDDLTRPLSSGLGLALFRDPYAVIPTIFHEFNHFLGDRNEASVFLKTQLFSIAFYKKYQKAKPAADPVFARMTTILGLPPEPSKRESLNEIIGQYYGKQVSESEAEELAKKELKRLNAMITMVNDSQTWDSHIKFPLLGVGETEKKDSALFTPNLFGGVEEDRKAGNAIHDAIVRFAVVPKSVTEEEFLKILEEETLRQ